MAAPIWTRRPLPGILVSLRCLLRSCGVVRPVSSSAAHDEKAWLARMTYWKYNSSPMAGFITQEPKISKDITQVQPPEINYSSECTLSQSLDLISHQQWWGLTSHCCIGVDSRHAEYLSQLAPGSVFVHLPLSFIISWCFCPEIPGGWDVISDFSEEQSPLSVDAFRSSDLLCPTCLGPFHGPWEIKWSQTFISIFWIVVSGGLDPTDDTDEGRH